MNRITLALALACIAAAASAQPASDPNKPILLVVGFTPAEPRIPWRAMSEKFIQGLGHPGK